MIAAYLTYVMEGTDASGEVRKLLLASSRELYTECSDIFTLESESRMQVTAKEKRYFAEKMGIPIGGFTELPMMEKGEHGKPYFPDYPNAHFSLSHTKGCVCCAWSDAPVGIDVERIREIRYRDAITDKFVKEEQDFIREDNDLLRFFRIWTGKESYTKKDGRGFLIPPDSFSVLDATNRIRFVRARKEEYVLSVCGECEPFFLKESGGAYERDRLSV